jgi:hypothetical protein
MHIILSASKSLRSKDSPCQCGVNTNLCTTEYSVIWAAHDHQLTAGVNNTVSIFSLMPCSRGSYKAEALV